MDFDSILGRYSNRLQVWPNNHHTQDIMLLSKKIIYRKYFLKKIIIETGGI